MNNLRFNTAIARITELNNQLTKTPGSTPKEIAEPLVLLLSPLVPHIAEELWEKLGYETSVVYASFPEANKAFLVEESIEIPIQINGKIRSKISVPTGSTSEMIREIALRDPKINSILSGATIRKEIIVDGKLVNFVI